MEQEKIEKKRLPLIVLGIVVVLAVCYVAVALFFQSRFLPNTKVNGTYVSAQTVAQAEQSLKTSADDYFLTIKERGENEQIAATDIGLEVDFGDALQQLCETQNEFAWPLAWIRGESLTAEQGVTYDEERFEQVTAALACMDEAQMTDSVNATLSDYDAEEGFELISAVYGTKLDTDSAKALIAEAVKEMKDELDLAAEGCYAEPAYTEDSEEAQNMLARANQYAATTVTYTFGDSTEVVDGSVISQWLLQGEDMSVTLDTTKTAEYVAALAEKYDTVGKDKSLTTTYGTVVTVSSGNYGWEINQEETCAALNGYLESGEDYTGDVVYSQTAASHGENDYGDTYVEINLTGQHLWFYKDGNLVVESDFVSGNVAKGHSTPVGAYRLTYKQKNAVLRGQGYASPVSFWMPFNGGVGLHDASWRSKFGGTIYKTNGSHGCINLPYSAAKQIYENISEADAVLVYKLDGTEQTTKSTTSTTKQTVNIGSETATENTTDTTKETQTQTEDTESNSTNTETSSPEGGETGTETSDEETSGATSSETTN